MRLYVMRNVDSTSVPDWVRGPESGHVFPYFTKGGMTVAVDESWLDEPHGLVLLPATSGMVVVHIKTLALFCIDVSGEAVPIGMRLPSGYQDGQRLGAELEPAAQEGS